MVALVLRNITAFRPRMPTRNVSRARRRLNWPPQNLSYHRQTRDLDRRACSPCICREDHDRRKPPTSHAKGKKVHGVIQPKGHIRGVHLMVQGLSESWCYQPPTVLHAHCNASPTITFQASEHRQPSAGYKQLY